MSKAVAQVTKETAIKRFAKNRHYTRNIESLGISFVCYPQRGPDRYREVLFEEIAIDLREARFGTASG